MVCVPVKAEVDRPRAGRGAKGEIGAGTHGSRVSKLQKGATDNGDVAGAERSGGLGDQRARR